MTGTAAMMAGMVKASCQLWLFKMTDEEVKELCQEIRESLDYIENGESAEG
jgi:hypothetical protein